MHYLIFTNHFQSIPEKLRQLMNTHIKIALDGGADCLTALNHRPDIILGDFDSIADLHAWQDDAIEIVHAPDQNYTDLEKGIQYCDERGAQSIDIVTATLGRLDHTLHHCRVLRKYHRANRRLQLHTANETVCFLRDSSLQISGKPGDQCSVLAFPQGELSSKGLVYDVEHYPLRFAESDSICNQLAGQEAEIQIVGDALIVLASEVSSYLTAS